MKSPSKFKTVAIYLLLAVFLFGYNATPGLSQNTQTKLSVLREGLLSIGNNYSATTARLSVENDILRRLLADSFALNVQLDKELQNNRIEPILNPDQSTPETDVESVADDSGSSADVETSEPAATDDQTDELITTFATTRVAATPLIYFDNPSFTLTLPTISDPNLSLDNGDKQNYVTGWGYLLGYYDNDQLIPFTADNSQLTTTLDSAAIINVRVTNLFTYEITLPAGTTPPQGLIESDTELVLGVKIGEVNNGNDTIATYQLPFQLQIGEPLELVHLIDINAEEE
jgi:hypothetical protein